MSWEHGFIIDRDPTLRKRVNCKDCINFDSSDRSCNVKGYYHPVDGYAFWKKCSSFFLDDSVANKYEKASTVIKICGAKYIPESLKNNFLYR